ncbi:MAG: archaellin/type IV pilin N-terminal domain-containing protein [Nanoarchaeota archaeon]
MNKKAISPVVATALLLVVAVVAVVGFQNWFGSFSSEVFADVEQQGSDSINQEDIKAVIDDEIYFVNGKSRDVTIQEIKIGDKVCNLSNLNVGSGMQNLSLNNCTQNLSSGYYDVVVVTDKNIISRKMRVEGETPGLCDNLKGGEWIEVPGNGALGTSDFCVMKYEAKEDSSGLCIGGDTNNCPQSIASGNPWVSLTWQQAKSNCEALGADYHLITDNEWLTIAKNAENIATNWNSSVVGTGFMYLGHNDNDPANSLAADTNDSNGYYGTNDGVSSPGDNSYSNFPSNDARAYQGQRRTLTLSNGEVIWDLAGNVWEWVDEWVYSNSTLGSPYRYHGGNARWMSYSNDDGTHKIADLVPALKTPSSGWNADNGMGRYHDGTDLAGAYNSINQAPDFCTGDCSPTAVFLRGGTWSDGAFAGAFALDLTRGPSYSYTRMGFRCSYSE